MSALSWFASSSFGLTGATTAPFCVGATVEPGTAGFAGPLGAGVVELVSPGIGVSASVRGFVEPVVGISCGVTDPPVAGGESEPSEVVDGKELVAAGGACTAGGVREVSELDGVWTGIIARAVQEGAAGPAGPAPPDVGISCAGVELGWTEPAATSP